MKRRRLLLAGAAAPWAAAQPTGAVDWPAITLLDGSTLSPDSWRQQPAVVVFWATWCAYCKRHNAHVETLFRATRGQAPLRVLGVAMDTDAQAVRRSVTQNGYSFSVALDNGQLRQRLTARRMIPMTCLIDRHGRLLQAIPGEMAADDVLGLAGTLQRSTS